MDISCQNFSVRKQIQEQIVTALPRGKAARFAVEVLQELRTQLPEQFHISAKMHCSDFETDGMNMHEALSYALQFEQAGLDSLEISGGNYRKLLKTDFTIMKHSFLPMLFPFLYLP